MLVVGWMSKRRSTVSGNTYCPLRAIVLFCVYIFFFFSDGKSEILFLFFCEDSGSS